MSKRILVIDDSRELLALIRMLLEDEDYGVSVLENGSRVIEEALQNTPDLIVLDLRLGATSGLDVLTRLRVTQATADIPIIVATAAVTEADTVERMKSEDPEHYANVEVLIKPFDGDALLERIKRMVSVAHAS